LLTGAITGERAGEAFTDLADLIIGAALKAVEDEMAETHGRVPGGRVAVIGMGKLGSRELTAGSDIDIILLYDHPEDAPDSDGGKPLDPVRYYTRLTQRLIAALSAPMAEGILYEVDLRLRPSGNKGPVATSVISFRKYQAQEAWTWEHMALTRARPVAGDDSLRQEARDLIDIALGGARDEAKLVADLVEMRDLIEKEKPPASLWDVKLIPGGLIDIEFIAQLLSLKSRAGGWRPVGDMTGTAEVLSSLGPDLIGAESTEALTRALALWSNQAQMVRLCIEGGFDPKTAPAGLVDLVVRTGEAPDIKALEADMKSTGKEVRALFRAITSNSRSAAAMAADG
jgi:glutamate-ammonia-ligase adenylyltransferase